MTTLRELQTAFQQYVLQPAMSMREHVIGNEQVDADVRLAIYADGYRLRLIGAMDANYPALHKWIGDEAFEHLALAYLELHPSHHYSIRWFGNELAQFMERTAPWRDHPLWCELAGFEWAMSQAFDAENVTPLSVEAFTSLPGEDWPRLRVRLHPSLRQLSLRWNVPALWHELAKEQESSELPDATETATPQHVITWRKDLTLYYRSLDVDEAWALTAAARGQTFADLCEGLCEWIDAEHVAPRAAGFMRQWVADELLIGLDA